MGFIRRMNHTREDNGGSRRSNHRVQPQQHEPLAPPEPNVITEDDAIRFLQSVEREYTGECCTYDEFIEILVEFKRGSICKEDVISRVKVLFDGHPDLILGFNEFLPEGYKINIQEGEEAP